VDKAWLEAQLSAGRSYEAIAEELGRDPSTVSYWARRHGLSSVHVAVHRARGGIDRDALARLVDEGLSVREIARRLELSGATVRHWLREHGLQTRRARTRAPSDADDDAEVALRECSRHGQTKFVRRGDERGWRCLRCRSEAVTRRRQKVKEILVRDTGGRCALCGYDRHVGALSFITSILPTNASASATWALRAPWNAPGPKCANASCSVPTATPRSKRA
jgi:transposase